MQFHHPNDIIPTSFPSVITPLIRGEQNNYEIVCAKDPSKAWADWMRRGITPPAAAPGCDSSVLTRNLQLAGRYGIGGAPTFFFPTGDRMTGAVSADQFEEILSEQKPAAPGR